MAAQPPIPQLPKSIGIILVVVGQLELLHSLGIPSLMQQGLAVPHTGQIGHTVECQHGTPGFLGGIIVTVFQVENGLMSHDGEIGRVKHFDEALFPVKDIDKPVIIRVDGCGIDEQTVAFTGNRTAAKGKDHIALAVVLIDQAGRGNGKGCAVRSGGRIHKIPGIHHKCIG